MTRFSGAWHPRWNRALIAAALVASVAIGAAAGLEQRNAPVALAAAAAPAGALRPTHARLVEGHARAAFFVVPQPLKYTPYGTPVTIPAIGTPFAISLTDLSGSNKHLTSCDLLTEAISRTVFVTDDAGEPVAGANVVFTVNRSDIEEPQMVSAVTGFDGAATVTVKVPGGGKNVATYSILAEAFAVHSTTPAASVRFNISDYTCTGVAGGPVTMAANSRAMASESPGPKVPQAWKINNPSLASWERVTEWPLVIAALLFLAAYAIPIIWPDLNHWLLNYANQVIVVTWFIFGLDYFFRLWLAKNKRAFIRHNLVDLFSIILPIARPLRLLRLVTALSILNRIGISTLRGRVIGYSMAFAGVVTFSAALAVTQAERAAGGNIHAFRDGIWWAFVTLTSTGYGDFYPITTMGRLIAIILMMTGVMLIGAVSASLASWLVQHALAPNADPEAEETVDLTSLLTPENFYDPTHPDQEE